MWTARRRPTLLGPLLGGDQLHPVYFHLQEPLERQVPERAHSIVIGDALTRGLAQDIADSFEPRPRPIGRR